MLAINGIISWIRRLLVLRQKKSESIKSIRTEVFLAESTSTSSFGRANLFSANFGKTILIPSFPYALNTIFIALIRIPSDFIIKNLTLNLITEWGQSFEYSCGTFSANPKSCCLYTEWGGLDINIPSEGEMILKISFDGYEFWHSWVIESGDGPFRANLTNLPNASLVDGRSGWNPLHDLALEVRSSLIIADQYATPEFIESFLPPNATAWNCRLIVNKKSAQKFLNNRALIKSKFPNLEVCEDDLIHDRFIVRDLEEAYVFGHSLKDLNSGRLSFFSRIYEQNQFLQIKDALEESWNKGRKIL